MNKYFDICASTPIIDQEIIDFINKNNTIAYGNPSSIHQYGQKSKAVLERARFDIAKALKCSMNEVVFTCGGSMSNNIALLGTLSEGDHFITSSYEHPAILNCINFLKNNNIEVSLIKPDKNGLINPNDIKKNIKKNTKLVSIMYINNEIGTINDIYEISKIATDENVIFHTDAVQAMGKINLNLENSNISLLSLSGHKFYGPKGVGVLYIKENTPVNPTIFGGGQESNLFPGTENIINIGAMGLAAKICSENLEETMIHIKNLDSFFLKSLDKLNIDYKINGGNRMHGIINITIKNTSTPSFVINLDKHGFGISAGSACASGDIKTSTTLKEIGICNETAKRTYRISFGKHHTLEDIDSLANTIYKNIHNE
mgnify:CR=1 FL=1